MTKTPVTVLQELATMRGLAFPNYDMMQISGKSHNPLFSCNVTLDEKSASAIASTKQAAKHKAASEMLKLFNIPASTDTEENDLRMPPKSIGAVFLNYVGKLNEFCSGKEFSQPIYTQSMESMTQFVVLCSLLHLEAKGSGRTKKDAKQDAAKNMLKLIENAALEKSPRNDVPQLSLVKHDQSQIDTVLDKYVELMENIQLNESKPTVSPSPKTELLVPAKQVLFATWEDLENHFAENGVSSQLTEFQKTPLILSLKVNQLVFFNTGSTREEILKKFLFMISELVGQGWDLTMSPFQRNSG